MEVKLILHQEDRLKVIKMCNGLRYSANERRKERYHNTSIKERQRVYQERKKKKGNKCKKCGKLISIGNKSRLCQSHYQTKVWEERRKSK